MRIRHIALLFVVFLDIMSQGLVIPILTTILLDPTQSFLAAGTSEAARQFDFGLVMGVFFLFWFFGAAYISKLSDFIGCKEGILICLTGNLLGYLLTVAALGLNSVWLLLLARAISGFTAGNQPIAQAALVDMSESETQKTKFLGYVLAALSLGLVAGPLIGGVFSDRDLLGPYASLELPFYIVSCLVAVNIGLIVFFFHNQRTERQPLRVRLSDVFLTLWVAVRRPVILKLSLVFFFGQLSFNSYYLFMDSVFFARFGFDTLQNSLALTVLGVVMGLSSAFLVGPMNERFAKSRLTTVSLFVMAASGVLAIFNPSPLMAYLLIAPLVIAFGVYYPTLLTLFSSAVDESEQGWVMGVTVALFTLGNGLVSLIVGRLMSIDIYAPFAISVGSAVLAALLVLTLWRGDDLRELVRN